MWPRSEPGALTVKLIPQSATSARIKAPDEKFTWGQDRAEGFCKHEPQRPLQGANQSINIQKTTLAAAHCDFSSLVGLGDPNGVPARPSALLHREVGSALTHLPPTHVKGDQLATAAVPGREAAHAGGSVYHTATLPLTNVDLQQPGATLVQDKCPHLVVLVAPGTGNSMKKEEELTQPHVYYDLLAVSCMFAVLKYLPSKVTT